MNVEGKTIHYRPSPTMSNFHNSNATVRGIAGPIGSGKSVACCAEIMMRARRQNPDKQGIRKTRWAIIRQTYPELTQTTIKTWIEWVPESICPLKRGGSPIEGKCVMPLPDGTIMDMEVLFLALNRPEDAKKVLSLELTGAWINEAREIDKALVTAIRSRCSRYPKKEDGAALSWTGVIMDTNPPDKDSWWYDWAEVSKPEGMAFFRQPPALYPVYKNNRIVTYRANPKAENVQNQNLGYRYWTDQIPGNDEQWILVHVCGEYGATFDGKPVFFGSYNDHLHASPASIPFLPGLPIILGWDFGLTPACVVGQLAPTGQLRILREYVCERGGIKQFAEDIVKPAIANEFPGAHIYSWGDPAGSQASQADDTLTCFGMLQQVGLYTQPTPTNSFLDRRQAVINRLTRNSGDGPAFLVDPSCDYIRKGFIGGYKFNRVRVAGSDNMFKDMPEKNKYSHPHDALQYLILGADHITPQVQTVARPGVKPRNTYVMGV